MEMHVLGPIDGIDPTPHYLSWKVVFFFIKKNLGKSYTKTTVYIKKEITLKTFWQQFLNNKPLSSMIIKVSV